MNALRPSLGGLLLTLAAVSAAEVETVEDLLHGSWHTIEVIIFEHATPLGQPSPEDLLHTQERAYPANLRSLAGGAPWPLDALRPDTRACLEQPLPKPPIPTAIPHGVVDPASDLHPLAEPPLPNDQSLAAQAGEDLGPTQVGEGRRPTQTQAAEHLTPYGPTTGPRSPPPRPAAQAAEGLTPYGLYTTEELPFTYFADPARTPPPIEPQLAPNPLLQLLSAAAAFEASLRQRSYRWLEREDLRLRSEANSIRDAGDLALLWHGSWMQPVPQPSDGQPLLLQLGQRAGAMHQLEGFLEVTQSTILHFRALLWRQAPPTPRRPARDARGEGYPGRTWRQAPPAPGLPAAATDGSAAAQLAAAAVPPAPGQPETATDGYMTLDQSRALRRGELHYLDHPKLGILVQISPVAPPAQLREALRNLP